MAQANWTQEQRTVLDAVLDQLIPANAAKDIPGAGELGVAAFVATRAETDPRLNTHMRTLLDRLSDATGQISAEVVRDLEENEPEAFAALLRITYMGYYSRADVRPFFGVGAHPIHPAGYEVAADPPELMADLTAPVRARGAFYRDV